MFDGVQDLYDVLIASGALHELPREISISLESM